MYTSRASSMSPFISLLLTSHGDLYHIRSYIYPPTITMAKKKLSTAFVNFFFLLLYFITLYSLNFASLNFVKLGCSRGISAWVMKQKLQLLHTTSFAKSKCKIAPAATLSEIDGKQQISPRTKFKQTQTHTYRLSFWAKILYVQLAEREREGHKLAPHIGIFATTQSRHFSRLMVLRCCMTRMNKKKN